MTRLTIAFGILLFFLLHTTSGEDGSSGDEDDDDLDLETECFSQLEIKEFSHTLTCNFMEVNLNSTNINLTVCTTSEERICSTMEKQGSTYFLYLYEIISCKEICVVLESKRKDCKRVTVTDIGVTLLPGRVNSSKGRVQYLGVSSQQVKPEAPYGINITFQKDADEYLIQYSTPHTRKKYLKDKLIHEIAYHEGNGTWNIKLLGKNLQKGASYEVKVRSKPDGKFFKGFWSEWSSSEYFQNAVGHLVQEDKQKEPNFSDDLDLETECFSQLEIKEFSHTLTCNFMEVNLNSTNINLTVCTTSEEHICSTMEKQGSTYFLYLYEIISCKEICVVLESKRKDCKSMTVTDIVKPEAPYGINITFQKDADEYLIQYSTPHTRKKYLKDKLIHEIAYHEGNGTWNTIHSRYLQIKLLGKNLQKGASYEVKVRSKPDGKFFKGFWSEWSSSEYFQNAVGHLVQEDKQKEPNFSIGMLVVTISTVTFVLLFIIPVLIFWETRIKPLFWPELPDHKKTLEQLCKKPKKNFDISFNPEKFGYVHIHKVDGIQAKTEVESFLQPSAPLDADVSEKVRNESDMKKSPTDVDKSVLKLPVTYGGFWPSDTLSEHLCETHPFILDGFSNGIPYRLCSSNGTQLCNYGLMTHSSSPADPTVQPRPGPINTDTMSHRQPSNGIRSSKKDEAYVTMSSFCKNQ